MALVLFWKDVLTIFLKKVITGVVLGSVLLGSGFGAGEVAFANTTANQYAQTEWNQYKLDSNVISRQGKVYLPLRSAFNAIGADVKWKPNGQSVVEVYGKDKSFYLYLKEEGGKTFVSGNQAQKGEAMLMANGVTYISATSLQSLMNRTLTVSGNKLTMIDYQPNWQNGANANALWKDSLKPVTKTQTKVDAAVTVVTPAKASEVVVPAPAQAPATTANANTAAPNTTVTPAPAPAVSAPNISYSGNVEALLNNAKSYIGVPYLWGGNTPKGFDCSGLTVYVYASQGVKLPRTSQEQQAFAKPVSLDELVPGDLVFWGTPAYHVGIYLGDKKFVHAAWSGQVEISSFDRFPYTGGGRVL